MLATYWLVNGGRIVVVTSSVSKFRGVKWECRLSQAVASTMSLLAKLVWLTSDQKGEKKIEKS